MAPYKRAQEQDQFTILLSVYFYLLPRVMIYDFNLPINWVNWWVFFKCPALKATTVDSGSGCGSVGRAVASNTRGLRFESSHWQNL